MFLEEFRRNPNTTWIMKPSGGSQGTGIIIINRLSQFKKWAKENSSAQGSHSFVISRYLGSPLLIGGKKFDLRLYVLVTSFRPLKAYIHREGFGRFCTVKYESTIDPDNMYVHLTNVSLQKKGPEYNAVHGLSLIHI